MTRKLLYAITGNRIGQNALDFAHHACQHLMGIGSGAGCSHSGESAPVKLLLGIQGPLTVFDVGANTGDYSKMVLRVLHGRDVRIHAFEPQREAFEALKPDMKCCLFLNNVALGSAERVATLYSNRMVPRLSSLYRRTIPEGLGGLNETEQVQVTTIDAYCEKERVRRIDLLKIDAEGHGLEVMRGGMEMFSTGKIGMVQFELASANVDSRVFLRDIFRFVRGYEFDVFRITPSGYLHPIPKYHERMEQFWTTNFLCAGQKWSKA